MRPSLGSRGSLPSEETDHKLPNSAWVGRDGKKQVQGEEMIVLSLEGPGVVDGRPRGSQILSALRLCSEPTFLFSV